MFTDTDAKLDRIAKALATRRGVLAAGAAALLPAAPAGAKKKCKGCCSKANGKGALLQVLHAVPNAPAVDVWVNDDEFMRGLAYGQRTPADPVPAGPARIRVFPTFGDIENPLLDLTVDLEKCRSVLFAVSGLLPSTTGRALASVVGMTFAQDRRKIKDPAVARASALHLSPDAPVVGVALDAPAASGYGAPPFVLATNIQFGDQSASREVPAGSYDVVVFDAATEAEALRIPGVPFAGAALTQVAVIGLAAGTPALGGVAIANATCCGKT